MSNVVLETENLEKVYAIGRRKINALSDVNLRVNKGDFVAIMGPSGSGKTTLLNLLGCLDRPTNGKVILDGVDVTKVPEKTLWKFRRYKIGFIFQTFNLLPYLSAIENVELPMEGTKKTEKRKKKEGSRTIRNCWTINKKRTQATSTKRRRATKSRYRTSISQQSNNTSSRRAHRQLRCENFV